jgi:hypothetical protein
MPDTTRSNVRRPQWLAGALLLWVAAMVLGKRLLLSEAPSLVAGSFVLLAAVGGFLAWAIAMIRLVASQDAFSQKIHLIAAAIAFVATAAVVIAADVLQTAGFIGSVPVEGVWMVMIVWWWFGLLIASGMRR